MVMSYRVEKENSIGYEFHSGKPGKEGYELNILPKKIHVGMSHTVGK